MTVFDDGTGPALYVGGKIFTAGGVPTKSIAKWNGRKWSPLGLGIETNDPTAGGVRALASFNDGSGLALYAGGRFITVAGGETVNAIAKWDGATWNPLGSGVVGSTRTVFALAVFDDGSGPALYAGGSFTTAGGVAVDNIAKWDGSSWTPVGGGLNDLAIALTVFDDGTGPALYAGGFFSTAGGIPANNIAKWDGSTWAPVGGGLNGSAGALTIFDDGTGAALYAGGSFTTAGGVPANHIAKWNGTAWAPLGSGVTAGFGHHGIVSMAVFDDGTGRALFFSGDFTVIGGVSVTNIAKWDGASWSSLENGLHNGATSAGVQTNAMAVFDAGAGPSLFVGGRFFHAGNITANNVASWSGQSWSGVGNGMNGAVNDMIVFNDGTGAALYAGGDFTIATGGIAASHIAKWNGQSWSPLGSGLSGVGNAVTVNALAVFDDGITGPALYVGGTFSTAGGASASNIAKWDGASWSPVGGLNGVVDALSVFDDGSGSTLYAGGNFPIFVGASLTRNIARLSHLSWSNVGNGLGIVSERVLSLTVFDDGAGLALYAAGRFVTDTAANTGAIAKWDGLSWITVGGGLQGSAPSTHSPPGDFFGRAMAVYDDGSGPALYVGGLFLGAGGAGGTGSIARWDGLSWSALGSGFIFNTTGVTTVNSLGVFDAGSGPALIVGSTFSGQFPEGLSEWNGQTWSLLNGSTIGGVFGTIDALAVFDDGSGPALFVGGSYSVSPAGDSYLAKWGCPPPPPNPADTNGDGVVNAADLASLLTNWGPCLFSGACRSDLNSDGIVDAADLAFLLSNWG